MRRPITFCTPLFALFFAAVPAAGQSRGYYRFPAAGADRVVFAAEGDLWTVPLAGGTASRLTTYPADEGAPAISPDGKRVAFSASYEGPTEAYVMPVDGGLPRRLTYDGGATVAGWTPDGRVLYRTASYTTLPDCETVAVDPATGRSERLPLAKACGGTYDAQGTFYFNRGADQGSRTKRYRGGTVQTIWKYARGAAEAVPLTGDFDGTSRNPMYFDGHIYFESDRDGTMNLWSMTTSGADLTQLTHHVGWDVQGASLAAGHIVYQLGADLRLYDIATAQDKEIPIALASDFDQMRERWITNPSRYLDYWSLSPAGDRLALVARGRVFVAPVKEGRLVEVTRRSNVRYRVAQFLGDGKDLAVLSDQSGEVEWWRASALGTSEPTQITRNGHNVRMRGVPSPDGKWIVHWNHDQEMFLTEVATGQTRKVAFSPQWGYDTPVWSPDSKWFAFGLPADNTMMQLMLYNVDTKATTPITDDHYNSYSAAFSPDGKWLYFLSDRVFRSLVGSPWGSYAPEPYWDKPTRVYALALQPGLRSPFQPADELAATDHTDSADHADTANHGATSRASRTSRPSTTAATIDLAGIQGRLYQLPIDAGNYGNLRVNGSRLFWLSSETGIGGKTSLVALDITNDDPKPKTLTETGDYQLSADGKKIAIRKGTNFFVFPASSGPGVKLDDAKVDLSGWSFPLTPSEDYHQLFVDSWRLERDYFYDPNLHGVDWDAMLKKYLPLVDRVRSRGDLADLQSQMAGELSTLHTFVYGGDYRENPEDIATATLGARLTRDSSRGGYRVEHIYRGDPDQPDQLSPLAAYGVDMRDGDVITAVNGETALAAPDIAAQLRNQVGKEVRLHVKPASGGERDVIVRPISTGADANLRYTEWEYTRRLAVDSMSHDSIGYVHLRAMGSGDIAQWYRDFYPAFNRQGLIIDVRHNRGGNIESWVLEKLIRKAWMYWQPRVGDPYWNMQYAFRGHIVVLVDQNTASDGEAFAEGFKRLKLGKVIGMRTWGGEIWLSSSNRLQDRGIVTAAENGVYGPDGKWLIEQHGVDPDSVVDNLPHATFEGQDLQLQAAVAHLKGLIKADPRAVPPHPPYAIKAVPDNAKKPAAGSH